MDMDLFTPLITEERYHPNFKAILSESEDYIREVLNGWANGFIDRDGKFVEEFQSTFNSSFWELYIFACLKELQFTVDLSHDRPDFYIDDDRIKFCIEACIASNPIESPPEWQRDWNSTTIANLNPENIVNLATIRIANALTEKYKKYKENYIKLAHVKNRPFIIAISSFDQPFFFYESSDAIFRVLYGFDKYIYEDIPEKNVRIVKDVKYLFEIEKPNGSSIPLAYFTKGEMNEVSAVLFSNTATMGKLRALSKDPGNIVFDVIRYNANGLQANFQRLPKHKHNESLLDGFYIFHNPNALHPICTDYFSDPSIAHYDFVMSMGMPMPEVNDGFLLNRKAYKFISENENFNRELSELLKK